MNGEQSRPQARFLTALERCVRIWFWTCVIAVVIWAFGFRPTWFSVVAFFGPVWVPIVALVLWGRMLDKLLNLRSDAEDGPR